MATFDRIEICQAHALLEWDYNMGGWLPERPSNRRRKEATAVQLHRMGFKPNVYLSFDTLSDNGKEIYLANVLRWKLPCDEEQKARLLDMYVLDWLVAEHRHMFAQPKTH